MLLGSNSSNFPRSIAYPFIPPSPFCSVFPFFLDFSRTHQESQDFSPPPPPFFLLILAAISLSLQGPLESVRPQPTCQLCPYPNTGVNPILLLLKTSRIWVLPWNIDSDSVRWFFFAYGLLPYPPFIFLGPLRFSLHFILETQVFLPVFLSGYTPTSPLRLPEIHI